MAVCIQFTYSLLDVSEVPFLCIDGFNGVIQRAFSPVLDARSSTPEKFCHTWILAPSLVQLGGRIALVYPVEFKAYPVASNFDSAQECRPWSACSLWHEAIHWRTFADRPSTERHTSLALMFIPHA